MQKTKLLLKIAVSLALVFWLVQRVDWTTVGELASQASRPLILGYIAMQILGNLISAAKWRYLARIQGFSFSLRAGFFAYLTGAFINNFLPSTVGGDTYRVLWMSRAGDRSRALSVVFYDRLTGLLGLFLFSGIGLMFFPWVTLLAQPGLILFSAITLSVTIMLLSALLLVEKFYQFFEFLVVFFQWPKLHVLLGTFGPFAQKIVYLRSIGWAALFMTFGIGGSNYVLFSSLGVELSLPLFISAIFAATLVANIPISINNIGVKEWSYVFFFGLVGVSAEVAVTAALCSRLLQMLISFLALPNYLSGRREAVS